jgi:hypothetical protein
MVAVASLTIALTVLCVRGVSRSSTRCMAWVALGLLVVLGGISGFTAGPALLVSAALLGAVLVVEERPEPELDHTDRRSSNRRGNPE